MFFTTSSKQKQFNQPTAMSLPPVDNLGRVLSVCAIEIVGSPDAAQPALSRATHETNQPRIAHHLYNIPSKHPSKQAGTTA